jgi:hypothetical protein
MQRLGALPWLVLATTAAFGLALSLHGAMYSEDLGVGYTTLLMRVLALIVGAIGTVRYLGRPPRDLRRWLGLPPRDWAFSTTFAFVATTALWFAK